MHATVLWHPAYDELSLLSYLAHMPRIPTLTTDRLILRPPAPGDAADLIALGGDAEVMRYIGTGQMQTPTQAIVWLEWMLADGRHGHANPSAPEGLPGWLIVIEQSTRAFVGLAVLQMLPPHKSPSSALNAAPHHASKSATASPEPIGIAATRPKQA